MQSCLHVPVPVPATRKTDMRWPLGVPHVKRPSLCGGSVLVFRELCSAVWTHLGLPKWFSGGGFMGRDIAHERKDGGRRAGSRSEVNPESSARRFPTLSHVYVAKLCRTEEGQCRRMWVSRTGQGPPSLCAYPAFSFGPHVPLELDSLPFPGLGIFY